MDSNETIAKKAHWEAREKQRLLEEQERPKFEDAAFRQRFLASIKPVPGGAFGAVGMPLGMPKDCPMMADFIARRNDGAYKDDGLNFAWWGWMACVKARAGK